jgi:hypothetical protein
MNVDQKPTFEVERKKYHPSDKKNVSANRGVYGRQPINKIYTHFSGEKNRRQWVIKQLEKQVMVTKTKYSEHLTKFVQQIKANENICTWRILLMSTRYIPPTHRFEILTDLAKKANNEHGEDCNDCEGKNNDQ